MSRKDQLASYEGIAVSIAQSIQNKQLLEGQHLASMVALGCKFGVSRETVRHGLKLLAKHGVVSLHHGRGGRVLSRKKAVNYLDKVEKETELKEIYQEITSMIGKQESDLDRLKKLVDSFKVKFLMNK